MRCVLAALAAASLIFAGCGDGSEPPASDSQQGLSLPASATPQSPSKRDSSQADFAIRNVRVFNGKSVVPNTTVLVYRGRITQIGEDLKPPAGAELVDGSGKTLIPGLIDCHTHAFAASQLETAAVFGVTTELDMAGNPGFASEMRSQQASGEAVGRADLFSAGTPVTARGGHPTQIPWFSAIPTLNSPDQALDFIAARVAEGSDYIKIIYDDGRVYGLKFPTISPDILERAVQAAHRHKMLAVAHIATREDARTAISAGVDGLVHVFVDQPIDKKLVQLARDKGVFVVPTLTVLKSAAGTAGGVSLSNEPFSRSHLTSEELENLKTSYPRQPNSKVDFSVASQAIRSLHEAGVRILVGTDAPNPGTAHGASMHRELELLVDAGLSPSEALASATSLAAESFRLSDRGRIAPDLRADLVLVDGDPTSDIRSTRRIVGVWKQGQPVDLDAHRIKVEAGEKLPTTPSSEKRQQNLVSDFEGEKVTSTFGSGWMLSTDQIVGGKSMGKFERVKGGAKGSQGSLLITGTIANRPDPRWAGVTFYPGARPMTPVDLSAKKSVSFYAKGDGKSCFVMLFFRKRGFRPSTKTFVAGQEWMQHRFKIEEFDGCDGRDIMGVFFGGGTESGDFRLQIDEVRFE